jgi:hypothetical protein
MQPTDKLLSERLVFPGPFFHAQEGIPIVSNLEDVPLPARDLGPFVGNDPTGLLQ